MASKIENLNPIENWGLMVQRWQMRAERKIEDLESHCHDVWENLRGTEYCYNMVRSMQRRLQNVIGR